MAPALNDIRVVQPKGVGSIRSSTGAKLFINGIELKGIKKLEVTTLYETREPAGARIVIELVSDVRFEEQDGAGV